MRTIDMNPLSKVRPDASVAMNAADTMTTRPGLAIKVAECIAAWAEVENTLGLVLGMLVGTDGRHRVALEMYLAADGRRSQIRMIKAAAKAVYPKTTRMS
jgi:hypothetical protein